MSFVAIVPVFDGTVKKAALEAVSESRRAADALGGEAVAVAIGTGAQGAAAGLGKHGAQRVVVCEDAALAPYNGDIWGKVAADAVASLAPKAVFVTATSLGKDLAPRAAAHLGASYSADSTAVAAEGGALKVTRPVYAGKSIITLGLGDGVAFVALRPNNFEITDGCADAATETFAAQIPTVGSKVVEVVEGEGAGKVDLTEASRIVSGGRGMKGAENFKLLESLAAPLGATVGASRAAVDAGWRPHSDQVGQTGKTVSPNLYIASGISGAIQHLAGMRTSKCIVAINKDPEAPIFKLADFGIVGDLFEVVPALEAELKKTLG